MKKKKRTRKAFRPGRRPGKPSMDRCFYIESSVWKSFKDKVEFDSGKKCYSFFAAKALDSFLTTEKVPSPVEGIRSRAKFSLPIVLIDRLSTIGDEMGLPFSWFMNEAIVVYLSSMEAIGK